MMRTMARGLVLRVMFPLLMIATSFSKKGREKAQSLVIRLNNALVRGAVKTRKILVLLPHCLQIDKCEIRLTHNVRNCKGCGRCEIKDLIEVSERLGVDLFVASGGNLARRIVADARPEAIVAVACERDLSSGIADVFPMPVIGVWNERPEGPCLNTKVSIPLVVEAITALAPN